MIHFPIYITYKSHIQKSTFQIDEPFQFSIHAATLVQSGRQNERSPQRAGCWSSIKRNPRSWSSPHAHWFIFMKKAYCSYEVRPKAKQSKNNTSLQNSQQKNGRGTSRITWPSMLYARLETRSLGFSLVTCSKSLVGKHSPRSHHP